MLVTSVFSLFFCPMIIDFIFSGSLKLEYVIVQDPNVLLDTGTTDSTDQGIASRF